MSGILVFFIVMGSIVVALFRVYKRYSDSETDSNGHTITIDDVNRFKMLLKDFTYYRNLSDEGKKKFLKRTVDIMVTKYFDGRDGLEVTEEMRILISASMAQATYGLKDYRLLYFKYIRIFPGVFYSRLINRNLKGGTTTGGVLMFSWKDFKEGYRVGDDKYNLGLHEIAHALKVEMKYSVEGDSDFEEYYRKWHHESYDVFDRMNKGAKTFLRDYAGVNMHEFFAVCVEHFFEVPEEFKKHMPEVYNHLCILLNQDPANKQNDYKISNELENIKETFNPEKIYENGEIITEDEGLLKVKRITDFTLPVILTVFLLPILFVVTRHVLIPKTHLVLVAFLSTVIFYLIFKPQKSIIKVTKAAFISLCFVLGGIGGCNLFLLLNFEDTKEFYSEEHKIVRVKTEKPGTRFQIENSIRSYTLILENNAYEGYPAIRSSGWIPSSNTAIFVFRKGFLGYPIFKWLEFAKEPEVEILPEEPPKKNLTQIQLDSIEFEKMTQRDRDLETLNK